MDYPFDLGHYSRPVSDNPTAQAWFDRGLVWLFGYNHEEAIVCFESALKHDAGIALAHWGIGSRTCKAERVTSSTASRSARAWG